MSVTAPSVQPAGGAEYHSVSLRTAPHGCLWLCGIYSPRTAGANNFNPRLVYPKRGRPSLSYSHGLVETVNLMNDLQWWYKLYPTDGMYCGKVISHCREGDILLKRCIVGSAIPLPMGSWPFIVGIVGSDCSRELPGWMVVYYATYMLCLRSVWQCNGHEGKQSHHFKNSFPVFSTKKRIVIVAYNISMEREFCIKYEYLRVWSVAQSIWSWSRVECTHWVKCTCCISTNDLDVTKSGI